MADINSYKKIEMFYKYNIAIKKILFSLRPIEYNDDENYKVNMIEKIDEIKKYFENMIDILNFHPEEKYCAVKIFEECQEKLRKVKPDINELDDFYHKYIYGIDKNLTKTIRHQTYAIGGSSALLIPKAKTINELLFIIHCSVNNDLNLYQGVALIDEKDNISIRGEETELSRSIYNSLSSNITPGFVEIISLKNVNKVLMLISKRGHATTIEITQNGDIIDVNYFIPRIYHLEMVNKLRGVTPVTEKDYYATGTFRCTTNDICNKLQELIEGIPMDKHMFMAGGTFNKRG